jgi:hypothetical protein
MTFTFNPTPESLFVFYKFACPRDPAWKRKRSIVVLVCRCAILCVAFLVALRVQNHLISAVTLVLFALCMRLTPIVYDHWFERRLRTMAMAADGGGFGPHEITLSIDGFREITPVTDTFIKWTGVKQVESLPGLMIVYLENGLTAVISDEEYHGPSPFTDLFAIFNGFREKYGKNVSIVEQSA